VTLSIAVERRVSGCGDRRMRRLGGRRKDDPRVYEFDLRVACEACGGWASISPVTFPSQSTMLCFTCPTCGHLEHRVGGA
jgi:hypothetical protein